MSNEIQVKDDAQLMESVLLQGDLSKLTPVQRVSYYQKVCESVGLNPLTKPFDYIVLKKGLTLYPTKSATEQLRELHGVSIDDLNITETDTQFVVKVKGHDKNGRTDFDIGVVDKKDMQGISENVQMKAVTKAKRRLTLSLCGLGWMEERYLEAVSEGSPVIVDENGEIRPKQSMEQNMKDLGYDAEPTKPAMTYEQAVEMKSPKGLRFGDMDRTKLEYMVNKGSVEQAEAALVILAHDFNVEPVEDPAPQS